MTQCYGCQKFGHVKSNCPTRNVLVCRYCSDNHDGRNCPLKGNVESYKCSNCESNHSTTYGGCPVLKNKAFSVMQRTQGMEAHTKNDLRPHVITYGLNDSLINWIQMFLNNRTQQVVINDTFSSVCDVSSGVPQGSIIGPLLFLIYINDIYRCGHVLGDTGGFRLFADDTKLFSTDATKLQSSLNNLSTWLNNRQLNLADQKCFSFHISKPSSTLPSFTINNCNIASTSTIKDLGIFISSNLKWTTHVNKIYKNARNSSYHIIKFSNCRNIWVLIKLYKTYVRPKLEHATPVWSPALKKDILKIERIQKDFTRFACRKCNIQCADYADRLYKLDLQSLEHRRTINDLIFLYKTINNLTGLNFCDYFIERKQPYNLRGSKIQIETKFQHNSTNWCNSFFGRVAKLWNNLPDDVKMSNTVHTFKVKLMKADLSEGLLYP